MKRPIAMLLAASMMLPSHAFAWSDPKAKEPPQNSGVGRPERMLGSGDLSIEHLDFHKPEEMVTAIVELRDEPVINPLSADEGAAQSQALMQQQARVQEKISSLVLDGSPVRVLYSYTRVTNGFAAELPYGKLDEVRALGEVERVYVAPEFKMAPNMTATTNVMGGLENGTGYKGEGRVIAIVDSGLDMSHAAFTAAPKQPALDQKAIADGLTKQLRAEDKYVDGTLTADMVYHGGKVPFAFDYADQDLDVNPGRAGDHGTHVAGIASANTGVHQEVVGVAPEAQLLAMKVFSSYGSGIASWENILAAMDDAVTLGADVINLSLGSTCGFSDYSWEAQSGVGDTLKHVTDAGVSLSVACGNEYSAALDNLLGKGNALAMNPDYGTVASPSVYGESLAVASVEKKATAMSSYLTAGQRKVAFYDISEATNTDVPANVPAFRTLGTGVPLDYVVIPGKGLPEDYAGLTLAGKIALVARGSITYEDKKNAARDAGAIGLLVYNNEPGMAYMQMDTYDLPAAFISQTDGEALAAVAEDQRSLTISATQAELESPTSGLMSDFSSWGVTPELTLKPDIAAPGGNILSTTIGGGYVVKSGTSMAAPFVSGAIAVARQYVEQQHSADFRNHQELSKLVDALLMSTADPVKINGLLYSPRKQGAGSVSVQNAVVSPAYLTAAGSLERPKLALGDDVSKTGVYSMSFDLHNWSAAPVTYTLGGTVQTDAVELNELMNGQQGKQVNGQPYLLEARVPAQQVTVQPGGAVTVSTTVTLTDGDKAYLNENFVNGGFVEGFLTLTPADGTPTLSLPYMGFFGDWTRASAIDRGFYWDDLKGEPNWASQYPNTAASTSLEHTIDTYLGDNPYHRGVDYLQDRSAISPNQDDYMDKLDVLYTGLLRNVEFLNYTITNNADQSVVYKREMDHLPKSVYSPGYFRIVPTGVDPYTKIDWDGKSNGISLPNNSKLTVTVDAVLPYHGHEANNECLSWSFPLTIDIEEPTIKSVRTREEGGKFYVDLEVSDNQYVSNICFADASGLKELASYPVAELTPGMTTARSYDVTGMGQKLTLVVNDYAGNRREQTVTVSGNMDDSQVIVPTRTVFTEDFETAAFPENGWKIKSTVAEKTWYQGVESGSKVAKCDFSSTQQQDEWLITPAIDLSKQSTQAGMVFDFYANYYWTIKQHACNLKVKASTDGQTWEDIWQLWDVKKEFDDWLKAQGKVIIPDKFQNAPALQLAFVYEGKDGANLYLDNVQVFVDDPTSVHTITASAGAGGSIAPEGTVRVSDKLDRTFTITPDPGCFIADVKVDGVSKGALSTYTFHQVTADHTIEAVFSAQEGGSANVLVDANFDDQTLPTGWVVKRTNAAETWTPSKQYKNGDHFGMSCNPDIWDAPFPAQDELLILPALNLSGKSGNISFQFSGQANALNKKDFHVTVEASSDQGATWTPFWDARDHASELKPDIVSSRLDTADMAAAIPAAFQKDGVQLAFRFARPQGSENGCVIFLDNVKVIAAEGQIPVPPADTFTITASAGQGGTITPSGIVTVEKGTDKTFTIVPGKGYKIKDVQVDGQSVGAAAVYTFEAVAKSSSITATFEQLPETLPTSIQEDFNTGVLPEGWTVEGPSAAANYDTWKPGRYDALNWPSVMLCTQNQMIAYNQNEYLILPTIQMPAQAKLTFDFGGTYDHLKSGLLTIQATLDKGASWTTIWKAAEHLPQVDPNAVPSDITAKGELSIPSNYCVNGAQFAFVFTSNQRSNGVAVIDNVALTDANAPAPAVYQIKAAAMAHGTVVTDKQSAQAGETVRLEIRPESGYRLQKNTLKVNGQIVAGSSFVMPAADVTITAVFEQIPVEPENPVYVDGTYDGQFMGHNGMVKVRVTVTDGAVAKVEILEQQETPDLWKKALAILDQLIGKKTSAEISAVDTVSGATDSSVAIKTAVLIALEQAVPNEDSIFASGDGTALNPYMIQSALQLTNFAASVNAGEAYRGKYIALGKDLSLKEVTWTPIGRSDHAKYIGFSGTFDGKGHTISDITCGLGNAPARYEALGFFGVLDGGVIRNLNLKINKYYNEFRENSNVYTGGLVGIMVGNSLVDHCAVAGNVMCISENSGCNGGVGAIAGRLGNGSTIANSWSNAGLSVGTLNFNPLDISMGGICGVQDQNSVIMNCASFTSVPGNIIDGVLRVGGLVGQSSGAIYNCYTTGLTKANIVGTDPKQPPAGSTAVGHLVGSTTTGAALYQCYYDKNAPQFSNGDLAAEPSEGKEERRQAVGWDPISQTKADLSHVVACDTADMMQAAFADTMNQGSDNANVQAADGYFKEKGLLTSNTVTEAMTNLEKGFYQWKLMGSTVLLDSTQKLNISVKDVADVSNVIVGLGVPVEQLPLPQKVAVTMSTNVVMRLPVIWDTASYSAEVAASYPLLGELVLPEGITNPNLHHARVTVIVQTEAPKVYPITVSSVPNGRVEADLSSAQENATVNLTVTPDPGYRLKIGSLKANDEVIAGHSFTMPAKAVNISAVFESASTPPTGAIYQDGVYDGEAQGFKGPVKVRVTVTGGAVASVDVLDQVETPDRWAMAKAVLARLLGKTTDAEVEKVDTVASATYSSKAIKNATLNALAKSVKQDAAVSADSAGLRLERGQNKAVITLSLDRPDNVSVLKVTLNSTKALTGFKALSQFTMLKNSETSNPDGSTTYQVTLGVMNTSVTSDQRVDALSFQAANADTTVVAQEVTIAGPVGGTEQFGSLKNGIAPDRVDYVDFDANGDGEIDLLDLVRGLKYYQVRQGEPDWENARSCDFNGDLVVDIYDYTALLNSI